MIAFERRTSRDHFLRFALGISAHVLISCAFLRMSRLMCSFILLCFGCLISCAHFLRFPWDVSAHVLISRIPLGCLGSFAHFLRSPWDVLAHVLISCDFLGMSQLTSSFLAISFGCISSRDHSSHSARQSSSLSVIYSLTHSLSHSAASHNPPTHSRNDLAASALIH